MTPRKLAAHGTGNRYAYGCRCEPCTKTAVREDAMRRLDRLAGRPRTVPVAGEIMGRVTELVDRPLPYRQVGEMTGVNWKSIKEIYLGMRKTVLRGTAERILAVPADAPALSGRVPALGSTRRLQALYAMGHFIYDIAEACELSRDMVHDLVSGQWATMELERVRAVSRAYDRLSMVSGNSWQARKFAQRNGWVPPLAWDEGAIDDPDATPVLDADDGSADEVDDVAVRAYIGGRQVDVTDRERLEAINLGVAAGMTFVEFDRLHGLKEATTKRFVECLRQRTKRHGEPFPEVTVGCVRKFTNAQVLDMRNRASAGETDLAIGMVYGIRRQAVQRIVTGGTYLDVGGPIRSKRESGRSEGSREFAASPLRKVA